MREVNREDGCNRGRGARRLLNPQLKAPGDCEIRETWSTRPLGYPRGATLATHCPQASLGVLLCESTTLKLHAHVFSVKACKVRCWAESLAPGSWCPPAPKISTISLVSPDFCSLLLGALLRYPKPLRGGIPLFPETVGD